LAVDRQDQDDSSLLNLTRRLIALRRAEPALRLGALRFLDAPTPLIAFDRVHGDEVLTCVFNLGRETIVWTPPGEIVPLDSVNADAADAAVHPPLSGRIGRRRAI
jgi:alpha-glucosidase